MIVDPARMKKIVNHVDQYQGGLDIRLHVYLQKILFSIG
jgi:hypothetical protein